MIRRARRTPLTWVAIAALIGLATLTADAFLKHTDDGCSVEIHCLACRASLGEASTAPAVKRLLSPAATVEWLRPEPHCQPVMPEVDSAASRGPPLT